MPLNKGMLLGAGLVGTAVVSATIYTFMSFTGDVVYEALSHPGQPPVLRQPPEVPIPTNGPLAKLLASHNAPLSSKIAKPDGPVAKALRRHHGPLIDRVRRKLGAFGAEDASRVAEAAGANAFEMPREINFDDPTGADFTFLSAMLSQGSEAQKASAARALVEIGEPAFAPSILTASKDAVSPAPFCLAALGLIGGQGAEPAADQLEALLADDAQDMAPACRKELFQARDGLNQSGGLPDTTSP